MFMHFYTCIYLSHLLNVFNSVECWYWNLLLLLFLCYNGSKTEQYSSVHTLTCKYMLARFDNLCSTMSLTVWYAPYITNICNCFIVALCFCDVRPSVRTCMPVQKQNWLACCWLLVVWLNGLFFVMGTCVLYVCWLQFQAVDWMI